MCTLICYIAFFRFLFSCLCCMVLCSAEVMNWVFCFLLFWDWHLTLSREHLCKRIWQCQRKETLFSQFLVGCCDCCKTFDAEELVMEEEGFVEDAVVADTAVVVSVREERPLRKASMASPRIEASKVLVCHVIKYKERERSCLLVWIKRMYVWQCPLKRRRRWCHRFRECIVDSGVWEVILTNGQTEKAHGKQRDSRKSCSTCSDVRRNDSLHPTWLDSKQLLDSCPPFPGMKSSRDLSSCYCSSSQNCCWSPCFLLSWEIRQHHWFQTSYQRLQAWYYFCHLLHSLCRKNYGLNYDWKTESSSWFHCLLLQYYYYLSGSLHVLCFLSVDSWARLSGKLFLHHLRKPRQEILQMKEMHDVDEK